MRFIDRTFILWAVIGFVLPFTLGYLLTFTLRGALTGLLWGGLVRLFLNHHVTWSVNSICHYFGRRPFAAYDQSTNNWVLALPRWASRGTTTTTSSPPPRSTASAASSSTRPAW